MSAPRGNQHGLSSNPQNRNVKGIRGKRIPRSKLKELANELLARVPKAMEIIDACLEAKKDADGEPIIQDKDQLQIARWICERAVTTQTAVLNEEKSRYTLKKELAEGNEDVPEEQIAEVVQFTPKLKLTFDENNTKKD